MPDQRLLNITQLAEWLDCKKSTIYRWVHEKRIPFTKVGRLVRFDRDAISEWLASRSHPVREQRGTARVSRMSPSRRFRLIVNSLRRRRNSGRGARRRAVF